MMTEKEKQAFAQEAAMKLMLNAGDARKLAQEALAAARQGQIQPANEKLARARELLKTAHNTQTELLTKEAQGDGVPFSLLTVHAQDHLMMAITYTDLAQEIISLYARLDGQETK